MIDTKPIGEKATAKDSVMLGGDSALRGGAHAPTKHIRAERGLWFGGQDYYRFVGAGDDGFGYGD